MLLARLLASSDCVEDVGGCSLSFLTFCCVSTLADDTWFCRVDTGHWPLGVIMLRDLASDLPLSGKCRRHRYVEGLVVLGSLVDDGAFSMNP